MTIHSSRDKAFGLAAGLVMATIAGTAFAANPYLYVGNYASGDISVISIPEHEVVSRIDVGNDVGYRVDDIIGSADGKTLFASVKIMGDHPLEYDMSGQVVAIDTATEEIKWRIELDDGEPNHISIREDGTLYVPIYDRNYLVVVDTNKGEVVDKIYGELGMHGTRLSPDEKRLYVGAIAGQSLFIYDLETKLPQKIVWFEDGVRPFAFTRDEKIAITPV